MAHEAPLITAITIGLCLAFVFGAIANRLRISPLVGYLLAGVLVGPNTPGFQADSGLVNQLAEIGVILLMFGVGLHFSLKDLLSVRNIAVPGALLEMTCTTLLGLLFSYAQGWDTKSGLVFGLALSTASTVVLLRTLQEKSLLESDRGRIAVGWLIVEDMAMVLVLVLLPVLANAGHDAGDAAAAGHDRLAVWLNLGGHFGTAGLVILTLAKVGVFVALMMLVGRRLIPAILKLAAQTGSRELFSLSVLAIALGVAFGSAELFGVSLALGAFFAGMIMSESELSHRAAEETLPLRDAFAVLFFVSVGMLFQPAKVLENFIPLLGVLAIILIGKPVAAFCLIKLLKKHTETALTVGAGIAQIGEFSFILAGFGNGLGLISNDARDLILGGAIISILLNPLIFIAAKKIGFKLKKRKAAQNLAAKAAAKADSPDKSEQEAALAADIPPANAPEQAAKPESPAAQIAAEEDDEPDAAPCAKTKHSIIIGYGATGQCLAQDLANRSLPFVIIENDPRRVDKAREAGFETLTYNALHEDILQLANIAQAESLILTIGNGYEGARIAALAEKQNPKLHIIARAKTDDDREQLMTGGLKTIIADSREIAAALLRRLPEEAAAEEKTEEIQADAPASAAETEAPEAAENAPAENLSKENAPVENLPADKP